MKTSNIKQINKAIEVLKHFVELSASLLPYLKKLKEKEEYSSADLAEIGKINALFTNYDVDENTSVMLIDSDIIGLIKSSFKAIKNQNKENDVAVRYYLGRFRKEYNRLRSNWKTHELN